MRWWILAIAAFFSVIAYFAESPLRLDGSEMNEKPKPQAILAPPEEKPKEEPEDTPPPSEDPLAKLAPESFQTDPSLMDSGFGAGYGSGGPALGSAMGLGGNMDQMVRNETSVDRPARVAFRGQLEYPPEARQRGQTGVVTLKILVEPTGALGDIKVAEANPPGVFDNAAMKAVRGWRFDPAFRKGQAAASWLTQKIRFEMN